MSEYYRNYYEKNKEHLRAYQAAYKKANPDRAKARMKKSSLNLDRAKVNENVRRRRGTPEGRLKVCWNNLIARCTYLKHCSYPYYGGKGIKNFLTFDDLKMLWDRDNAVSMVKPSIDREKSDGDYTLENCRFIEQSENSRRALHRRKP